MHLHAEIAVVLESLAMLSKFKKVLVAIGEKLPLSFLNRADSILKYLWLGKWIAGKGYVVPHRYQTRRELFADIAQRVNRLRVLYLEFGVAEGQSFKLWSRLLQNPESRLHGFDTFTGLPFDWNNVPKGAFSVNGQLPEIPDSRAQLFAGLFEETLPTYELPDSDVRIINIDCDLYSSAIYVLKWLIPHIKPGDFLYFDEFEDRSGEMKAFSDFLSLSGKQFKPVAATECYCQIAFQCVA